MMPVVRISDATLGDLKVIATWLETRTPSETIEEVVRETMDRLGLERDLEDEEHSQSLEGVLEFERAPGLSFTRVLNASVNGEDIHRPNWARVLIQIVSCVKSKGISGEDLKMALQIPARVSEYEDEGYKFYDQLGISIQGQSATDAWKEIDRLAREWSIPVEVRFQWRESRKAQHPGKVGLVRSGRA